MPQRYEERDSAFINYKDELQFNTSRPGGSGFDILSFQRSTQDQYSEHCWRDEKRDVEGTAERYYQSGYNFQ